jgi:D-alanyl-D-alanine dipeptidase
VRCEEIAAHPEFRRLSTIGGIAVDLRYASPRNFVGRDLYGGLDCAWLHRQAAEGLEHAVGHLAATMPEYRLLVLDALRPHRVQMQLWAHLDGTGLRQYVADPARGSIHSFGMALDATLIDGEGRELDMGTGFDEMIELSQPRFEARHLASGALTKAHLRARELLRATLGAAGFRGIANEWWHFELLEREHVRAHFVRVD